MNTIIIDDEPHCRNVLVRIIEKYCPQIKIVDECKDGVEGMRSIEKHRPDLIFLDIEMPQMNGFQMLESIQVEHLNCAIIFTTAYDKFAIKAFKFSAFDYLLKPIDEHELVAAITRLQILNTNRSEQLQSLYQNYQKGKFEKVTISTLNGVQFLDFDDIILIEADSNYSRFYLKDNKLVVASKTLAYFDEILSEKGFFRSHKQFIVNLKHIKEYKSGDWNVIIMSNQLQAKLARTKREEFLHLFSSRR